MKTVRSYKFGDPDHSDIHTSRGLAWSLRKQRYLRIKSNLIAKGYKRITPSLIATFIRRV